MFQKISILLALLISMFGAENPILAQNTPININISVNPPYSMEALDYFSSPTQTTLTLVNTSQQVQNIFLAGSLRNLSTNQSASIRNDIIPAVPQLALNPGVTVMTGADLQLYIDETALQFSGISQQSALNGNLPEGEYQFCLQAYDYSNLELRSQTEPLGCSNIFTIQFVQPPLLITPTCSTEVVFSNPQNIVFSWVPPSASINPAFLNYEFKLIEVPQGLNALAAMNAVGVPVITLNTNFTTIVYSAINPTLNPGRQYAWRVKVSDASGTVVFANNGISEICEFTLGLPFTPDLPNRGKLIYPVPGKRIPFRNVPMIVQYEPYDSTYRSYNFRTSLTENGESFDLIENTVNWPNGADAFLQQQLTFSPSLLQLTNLQVGRNLVTSPGSSTLRANKTYNLNTGITFTKNDGSEETVKINDNFTQGFEKPLLKQPARDTAILNRIVKFKFNTSDTIRYLPGEAGLIPPSEITKALKGTNNKLFKAEVKERYRIEVSKTIQFDSLISAGSKLFEASIDITSGNIINFVKNTFYKEIEHDLYLPDTGTYFWRVHWLTDVSDSASAPYETSVIQSFRIFNSPSADSISSACVEDCNAPVVTNRNPATDIIIDQMVQVGKFQMKIKSINYNGPMANGLGEIRIPFMNTVVKVQFAEALINSEKQLFQGNVVARYDTIGFLPSIPGIGQLSINNGKELMDYLANNRHSSVLDPNIPMGLPLGLDKESTGERFVVAIVGMNFNAERATLAAATSVKLPFLDERLSDGGKQTVGLGASDICFHPDGLAGSGLGALYLTDPVEIAYTEGQYILLKNSIIEPSTGAVADSGTFYSWDCHGFRLLHVEGEISFSDSVLIKASTNNSKPLGKVKARFGFNVRRSGNWLATLDVDPFQIPGLQDWNFIIDEATMDFSDLENSDAMVFPVNYAGERSTIWNGVHFKSLKVGLPKQFKLRTPSTDIAHTDSLLKDRVVIGVNNVLIDRSGVSGKLEALRLLEIENGMMGDWGFGIDTLSMEITSNSFVKGGFSGKIITPLSPTKIKYASILSQSPNNGGISYQFNVKLDTLTVPIWAANMTLLPTSHISVTITAQSFTPELNLNGSFDITRKIGEIPVRFAGVKFQQLKLSTNAPYLSCNSFAFASPQKEMSGFPVTISNINIGQQDFHGLFSWDDTPGPRLALNFTLNVNFTGETNTFGGSTTLAVLGRFKPGTILGGSNAENDSPWPSLALSGVDLKSINIQGDLGFVELKGYVNFYAQDSIYGQGFNGGIEATFIKTIKVSVVGGFGEIDSMRYWYVDAMTKFVPGIPMGITPYQIPMDIYGFGGGAFYKMRLAEPPPPAASISTATVSSTPPPGTTLTNVRLVPDPNTLFGLKATVIIGTTGGGQAFNADITLTATFNNSGGISQIAFDGDGYFMTSVMDRSFTAVKAGVLLQYDFNEKILTGNFDVMINVPLTLTGRKENNVAGNAYLYVGPDKWQILVGEPSPNTARVGVLLANSFDASGYLMAGEELPSPPPPPSKVLEILGELNSVRSPGIAGGRGFAFGASFQPPRIQTELSPFFCNLDAEIGFDMNMFDYGASRCDGMNPGERMGINGWYANGSIWGYFDGNIGIEADVFGDVQKYNILNVKAAVLMQAGFPNPYWMNGTLGGRYSLLGGLIEGNCRYKLELGDYCAPAPENPISGLKMISEISPSNALSDVDCGISPSALFNVDINKVFDLTENSSDGSTRNRRFKFILEDFKLRKGSANGSIVTTTLSTSLDGTQAMLMTNDLLDAFTNYYLTVTVKAQENINGIWTTAKRNNNTEIRELLSTSFKTGARPDKIRDQDVSYCYPFNKQRYFVKDNTEFGLVKLKYSMAYIFNSSPAGGYNRTYHAIFQATTGGATIEKTVSYIGSENRVKFDMPVLNPNTIYQIRIIHRDIRNQNQFSTSINTISNLGFQLARNQFTSVMGENILIRNRRFNDNQMIRDNEHLIYEYYFRTSGHSSYLSKINALGVSGTSREFSSPIENLILKMNGNEGFERYEIDGFPYQNGFQTNTLKKLEVKDAYSNTPWHFTFLKSSVYDLYTQVVNNNYSSIRLGRSTPDEIGIPPTKVDASIKTKGPLTAGEINPSAENSGGSSFTLAGNSPSSGFANLTPPDQWLILSTSYYAKDDFQDMKAIVSNMKIRYGNSLNGVNSFTKAKVTNFDAIPTYRYMNTGNYDVKFSTRHIPGSSNSISPTILTKTFNYPQIITLMQFITF